MKPRIFTPTTVFVAALLLSTGWIMNRNQQASAQRQSNSGRIVIVGYKPKPGKADTLRKLSRTHVQRLRAEGLVTAREAVVMEAKDGTIIEVFEWKSKQALESAHSNPVVQAMWKEYAEVCDYVPVGSLEETKQLFSEFSPLE